MVRNREGFLVSRLFVPYLKEAFWLMEEGAEAETIDRAMVEFGFPMGPLTLIDMAGLDILVLTDRVLRRAFPRHGGPAMVAEELVRQGHLGQKTGSGIYLYAENDYTPKRSEVAQAVLVEVRQRTGRVPRGMAPEEITQRLVLRMVSEAFFLLEEAVAQRASDIDVATVLGIGFPDFRGGVVKYAHDLGLDRVLEQLEQMAVRWGPRFAPSEWLQNVARRSAS